MKPCLIVSSAVQNLGADALTAPWGLKDQLDGRGLRSLPARHTILYRSVQLASNPTSGCYPIQLLHSATKFSFRTPLRPRWQALRPRCQIEELTDFRQRIPGLALAYHCVGGRVRQLFMPHHQSASHRDQPEVPFLACLSRLMLLPQNWDSDKKHRAYILTRVWV